METLLYRTQMMELGTIITKRSVAQRGIILIAARLVETEQIEASTGFNLTWIIIIFTMKMFIIPVIWLYIKRIFLTRLSLSLTQFYICKSLPRKQTIATLCIFLIPFFDNLSKCCARGVTATNLHITTYYMYSNFLRFIFTCG